MSEKLHFLTYGDSSKYYISRKHITNMAKKSNFFESINSLSKSSLDQQFLKNTNIFYLSQKVEVIGYGNPVLFLIKLMKLIKEILLYILTQDLLLIFMPGRSFMSILTFCVLQRLEL